MELTNSIDPRFPIGKFKSASPYSTADLTAFITIISNFPEKLSAKVKDLSPKDLQKTYREGGWNVLQLVHHLADSHMNSFIRFKLALTEDNPTIKPYLEAKWAEMPDVHSASLHSSLSIIEGVHARWTILTQAMTAEDFSRTFHHPESGRDIRLDTALALYAWHCDHHFAHINLAN